MLSIFSCACWPSVCLLWRNVCSALPIFLTESFVFLILNSMSYLYISDVNPWSVTSFANIFSSSIGCLFVLLMVSLAVLQFFFFLLSLIRTHLEGGFFLLPTAVFLHIYRLSSYWTYGLLLFYSPIFILSRTCCIPFSQIHHLYL